MTLPQAEQDILELATEDFFGLWEVRWEIERNLLGAQNEEILHRCCEVLRSLLRRGWINVFSGELKGNEMLPVDQSVLEELLNSPESWKQPIPGKPQLAIGATDAGKQAYFGSST